MKDMNDLNEKNKIGFLFDLDGVLIDSEKEYTRIWDEIDRMFPTGVEGFSKKIKGTTLEKILDTYFAEEAIKKKVIEELFLRERKMVYTFCPGAKELLEEIKSCGYPIALNTSSNDKKMKHLKEQLPELFDYMDAIVTGDQITHSKPNPESYLLAAKKIGVEPGQCIVFEDALQGAKAGKNAGAYVVGVAGTLPREILAPECDIVIDSLTEAKVNELGMRK